MTKPQARMKALEVLLTGRVPEPLFCIHNKKGSGCVGNSMLFWRVDGCGYTVDLDEAWKVTKARADEICRSRPKEDFSISYTLLESLAKRHVDIQAVNAAFEAKKNRRKAA